MKILTQYYNRPLKKLRTKYTEVNLTKGKNSYNHGKIKPSSYYNLPYQFPPDELKEQWKMAEEYLYKMLDYSENNNLTQKEYQEARKQFYLLKNGPQAHCFIADGKSKLTSADVLYILSTDVNAEKTAKCMGLHKQTVNDLRQGKVPEWLWEYNFVKRLKHLLRRKLKDDMKKRKMQFEIYVLYKLNRENNKELIAYTTSYTKAKNIRKDIVNPKELEIRTRNKTIDIYYPIEKIEVI